MKLIPLQAGARAVAILDQTLLPDAYDLLAKHDPQSLVMNSTTSIQLIAGHEVTAPTMGLFGEPALLPAEGTAQPKKKFSNDGVR